MTNKNRAFNAYKEQQLQSKVNLSKPEELTLILYEELVKNLLKAKLNLESENKSYEVINNCLIKSQEIILVLKNTLDFKYEISNNLNKLYDYLIELIINANRTKEVENLEIVIELAKELRDTWKKVTVK